MKIVKLPAGEAAPIDSDCIKIVALPDGSCRLEGSVLLNCGDGDEVESVSLVDGGRYGSADEAESAGSAWAEEHCVERLFVSLVTDGTDG